jgi:hypothetical protein
VTPYEHHKARMAKMSAREREAWNARQRAYYHQRKAGVKQKLRLCDFMPPDWSKFNEMF